MEKKIGFVLLLLLALAAAQSTSRATQKNRGAWSGHALSLFNTWGAFDDNPDRSVDFVSPDGKKTVRVRGEDVSVLIDGKKFPTKIGEMTNGELIWSPDSVHFVVTYTDGGELGRWKVNLFQIAPNEVRDLGVVSRSAAADYRDAIKKRRPEREPVSWKSADYCDINAVAVKWVGPSRIALATLVPNTSRCRHMSDWDGYIVKVPSGEIDERVAAKTMIQRFGSDNVPLGN